MNQVGKNVDIDFFSPPRGAASIGNHLEQHWKRGRDRKRAARACDQCRKVKERCEGGFPCKRCTHLSRQCTIESSGRLRGHQSQSQRRPAIPGRAARSQSTRLHYLEALAQHFCPDLALNTNDLAEKVAELGGGQDSEDIRSGIPPGLQDDAISNERSPYSWGDLSMLLKFHLKPWMFEQEVHACDFNREGWQHAPKAEADQRLVDHTCYPPKRIAEYLAKSFLQDVQRNFFYVGEDWLIRQVAKAYDSSSTRQSLSVGSTSVLFSVFAIATQYAQSKTETNPSAGGAAHENVGHKFHQYATQLLPRIIETASLESVQAVLLLALYNLPVDIGVAQTYYSLGLHLAMRIGLHKRQTGVISDSVLFETRNRVWWTAHAVQRKVAIFHGGYVPASRSHIDAPLPTPGPETPSTICSLSIERMVVSIKLIDHLEDLLGQMMKVNPSGPSDAMKATSTLFSMRNQLLKWWESLPSYVLQPEITNESTIRSCCHLRLLCCLIRMFVGRTFLFPTLSSTDSATTSREPSSMKAPSHAASILMEDCVAAAEESLQICRTFFESSSGLFKPSYMEYCACRGAILILIAYSILEQNYRYREILQLGVSMLRDMTSRRAEMQSSLTELLQQALARLETFGITAGARPNSSEQEQSDNMDESEVFRDWLTAQSSINTHGKTGEMINTTMSSAVNHNWTSRSTTIPAQHALQYRQSGSAVPTQNVWSSNAPGNEDQMLTNAFPQSDLSVGISGEFEPQQTFFPELNPIDSWFTQAVPESLVLENFLA